MTRKHVPWAVRVCVAVVALLPLAFSVPVSASTTSSRAGYSAPQSGSSASAHTTFTVPTVSCPTSDFQLMGLRAVIRTSAGANNGAFILTGCSGGSAFYYVQFQVNGTFSAPPASPVLPGDRVLSSTSETASATTESMTDMTQGWTQSATGSGATPILASVGIGGGNCTAGAPPCAPIPQFTPAMFTFSTIDGVNLAAAGAVRTDLTSGLGAIQATASKLIQAGMGFKISWVSSCTPDPSTGKC